MPGVFEGVEAQASLLSAEACKAWRDNGRPGLTVHSDLLKANGKNPMFGFVLSRFRCNKSSLSSQLGLASCLIRP